MNEIKIYKKTNLFECIVQEKKIIFLVSNIKIEHSWIVVKDHNYLLYNCYISYIIIAFHKTFNNQQCDIYVFTN